MQTGEEKIFFNSLLGSSEAEITAINGDQVTFKNSKGESLTLRLTANSLIVFPDGTSNSRIDGLHVGSNVLLTARMTDGQNEITSININDGVGVTNQNTKSQNVSPIPYASSLP